MTSLSDNDAFKADYEKLKQVMLDPARHAAENAWEHSELVRVRARHLGELNSCTEEELRLLDDLAMVHDIGKIRGTSAPAESVKLLPAYGLSDEAFSALVKYHDTNLPWFQSMQKGQPPADRAWNRLARKVNMRLLCLFMVADRADCPGGWSNNQPLVWFLDECRRRGFLAGDFIVDPGPAVPLHEGHPAEHSAGGAVVAAIDGEHRVLLIRVRDVGYELPKGHIEGTEPVADAAIREIREETGITTPLVVSGEIGQLSYAVDRDDTAVRKDVTYFLVVPAGDDSPAFGARPARTRELKWVPESNIENVPLVNEGLRPVIAAAFQGARAGRK